MTERLKVAIEEDNLRLAYQPQFDVTNRQIRGFEALLRWVDPKLGQVSPAEFIPIAEECGLIVDIGTWVLRRACQQAAEWPGEYLVAVNISSAQIEEDGFTGLVEAALADSGLAADRLELELTETMLLNWTEETERCLSTLRQMNVGIAMDDFGTGHSSLTYLASIPISKLKIDKSFVDHVGDHGPNDAIVKAVVSLADNLNLTVIAEGVETIQQSHMLESLGCTNIQGYLYGKPEFEPFSAKGPVNRLIEEAAERLEKEVA